MINKNQKAFKEQFVLSRHVTREGLPRSISFHEPTEQSPKAYWVTQMPDRRKVKATTYHRLMEKLFNYYANGSEDMSFGTIFKTALAEKAVTENPKQNTLDKYEADFHRFVNAELAAKDICTITEVDLKKYIQEWVNTAHPKKKAYLSFKGILNLTFEYAYAHKFISENPVKFIKNKSYMKSCDTRRAKPEEKILSPEEINELKTEVRHRMTMKKYGDYYINGYAMLFAIETGVRVGELCALKWEDIRETSIHIHSQQLSNKVSGGKNYYLVPYTKNEKGESEDGREFPLTRNIKALLTEIRDKQRTLHISSEFIFCHEDGEWIKTDAYLTFLRRLCQAKNFKVTNNHALRMSLNSNVLIPKGISVADRAAMLGHSVETNLRHYSFARKNYIDDIRAVLDSEDGEGIPACNQGTSKEPNNLIHFPFPESSK